MKRLIFAWVCGALVMASCGKSNASASDSSKEKVEKAVVADSAETKGVVKTANVDSSLPKGIPATAKLADEDEEMAVYLNVEEKAKDIGDNDVTSVWVYWKEKDEVKKLLTTTKDNGEWPTIDAKAKVVKPSSIHAVFEAKIQPYSDDKLLIEGCPGQPPCVLLSGGHQKKRVLAVAYHARGVGLHVGRRLYRSPVLPVS